MQVNLRVVERSTSFRQRLVRHLTLDTEAMGASEDETGSQKHENAKGIEPDAALINRQAPYLDDLAARENRQCLADTADALPVNTETRRVDVRARVSGTVKAVNIAAGTITIAAGNGKKIALGVVSDTAISVDGAAVNMAELSRYIGANVNVVFSAGGGMTFEIKVDTQSTT